MNKPITSPNDIEWISSTHPRTTEEALFALQWCAEHSATINFQSVHVRVKLPNQRRWTRAYDLADAVKSLAQLSR